MTQRLNRLAGRQAIVIVLALALLLALSACPPAGPTTATPPAAQTPATTAPTKPPAAAPTAAPTAPNGAQAVGDPERGKAAVVRYNCGPCHVIPGVQGAVGTVGPSLAGFGSRPQIAGVVPNTPENLVRWLMNPPAVKPGTAMPSLGVTEPDARDISAFLYTLK